MAVTETVYFVDIYSNDQDTVEVKNTSSTVEVINDDIVVADIQTTSHIIEVVRRYANPIDTTGSGISVDVVNAGSGTLDTEAIAAIVRLVYVANEIPTRSGDTISTAAAYKPDSTRLFVNGLRQEPGSYVETGGTDIELTFTPTDDDTLLIDYIKM